jgi:hypothetical protein
MSLVIKRAVFMACIGMLAMLNGNAARGETLTMTADITYGCPDRQRLDKMTFLFNSFDYQGIADHMKEYGCAMIGRNDGPFEVVRDNASSKYCEVKDLFGKPTFWVLCGSLRVPGREGR